MDQTSQICRALLFYIHDPMCSWCWGFRKTLQALLNNLPAEVKLVKLVGGLAADNDQPMPQAMQDALQVTWKKIQQQIPGVVFNFDFWTQCSPRRSTYPACRAVLAARKQGVSFEDPMILRIQKAYYREARNPSDHATLVALAGDIGLDTAVFANDLHSAAINEMLIAEIQRSRSMHVDSFPSLVLETDEGLHHLPVNYTDIQPMLANISAILAHHT